MVHALNETWRVLKPGGRMIDTRPQAANWPVEVFDGDKSMIAGRVDDTDHKIQDKITDEAVEEAVRRGWFQMEKKDLFEFAYDWDSVTGMQTYIEEEWENYVTIPEEVLSEARRLAASAEEFTKVRVLRNLMIAGYRKLAG